MATASQNTSSTIPSYMRFIIGGASGSCAACVTHPLDVTKTRMQVNETDTHSIVKRKTTIQTMRSVVQNEGFTALYSGLSASILRQVVFTSGRMGYFSVLLDMGKKADGQPAGVVWKTFSGLLAGMLGALTAIPSEVALIRMAADGHLPLAERRNYKNAIQAIARIAREEGYLALYSGAVPTMGRAMVVNVAQVVTYSHLKEKLVESGYFQDGMKCHFVVSMVCGVLTVVSAMPLDIAKTRLQNMKTIDGKAQFTGLFDVWTQVVRNEGPLALWKGITPAYLRIGPHTILFFLCLENFTRLYKVHVLKDSTSGGF